MSLIVMWIGNVAGGSAGTWLSTGQWPPHGGASLSGLLNPLATGNDSCPLDDLFPSLVEPLLQILNEPVGPGALVALQLHGLRQLHGRRCVGDDDDTCRQEEEWLANGPNPNGRLLL